MQHLKYGDFKQTENESKSDLEPKIHERHISTTDQFEEAFRNVILANPAGDVVEGVSLLVQLSEPLL